MESSSSHLLIHILSIVQPIASSAILNIVNIFPNTQSNKVEISSRVHTRLKELTKSINVIYKSVEIDKSHLFEIILAKNRIFINDLENLIFSITLAKVNLIIPVILDKIDIKEFNQEMLTNFGITDLL